MSLSASQIIEEIVARQLALHSVEPDSRLIGEAESDLEPLLRVILAVEEALPVAIPDSAIEQFATVQDLVDFVHAQLRRGEPDV